MRHHELKIDPRLIDPIIRGEKTFEVRRDDRDFRVGDTLTLRETVYPGSHMRAGNWPLQYTGREWKGRITHVLRGPNYGVQEGYSVLSIQSTEPRPDDPQKSAQAIVQDFVRLCVPNVPLYCMDNLDELVAILTGNNRKLRGEENPYPATLPMFHSPGAEAICRERRRQVEEEGYTQEKDAELYEPLELLLAGRWYLALAQLTMDQGGVPDNFVEAVERRGYPWPLHSYPKPCDSYQAAVKGAALVAAHLDLMGWES